MSVARAKSEVSSAEFVDWLAFEEEELLPEMNRSTPERWLLAQIAREIRVFLYCLVGVSKGEIDSTTVDKFLVKFQKQDQAAKRGPTASEIEESKAFWRTIGAMGKLKRFRRR